MLRGGREGAAEGAEGAAEVARDGGSARDARDAREGALRGAARADATFVRAPRDVVST